MAPPAILLTDLVKRYGGQAALAGVSLKVPAGQFVALVGASGSGKTTLLKTINRLVAPDLGQIAVAGQDASAQPAHLLRRRIGYVFQEIGLFPHLTVAENIAITPKLLGWDAQRIGGRVANLMGLVDLPREMGERLPAELSGGQRQRVGLARALSVSPTLLVADEPVSALDVSVQASILNLLRDLQEDLGFSCLFITHDLATVEYLCDRVAVMYLGKIVELSPTAELFASPRHPYTQALLSAAAVPDPEVQRTRARVVLEGDIPSPIEPPSGVVKKRPMPPRIVIVAVGVFTVTLPSLLSWPPMKRRAPWPRLSTIPPALVPGS